MYELFLGGNWSIPLYREPRNCQRRFIGDINIFYGNKL